MSADPASLVAELRGRHYPLDYGDTEYCSCGLLWGACPEIRAADLITTQAATIARVEALPTDPGEQWATDKGYAAGVRDGFVAAMSDVRAVLGPVPPTEEEEATDA